MTKKQQANLSTILTAIYRPAPLPEHAGNPLIEALPPFYRVEDIVDAFARIPHIADEERRLPAPQRMQAVLRLNEYLEVLPSHFDVIEQIGLLVRAGYAYRNLSDENYPKLLNTFYHESMNGKIQPIGYSSASTAPSFALFGVSGVGKSSVVERALSFLPQALLHEKYGFVQVVWLKLDCPLDGSLKQLLNSFLAKLDELLGTSYQKSMGRGKTIDELILSVAKISAMHHLGMLVIDEIQNLLDASGVGQAKMLNFFVTFANEVKIPVFTMGTPRALSLLEGTFREARRVGDHGTHIWDALPRGKDWSHFLNCLWQYQWTAEKVDMTADISKFLHDHTQGIHALVVRLFQLSQLHAIREGSECITKELISGVAHAKFKLIAPMLKALKNNDKKGIEKYEDLLVKGLVEIKDEVGLQANLSLLKAQAQKKSQLSAERTRTISALIAMGFEQGRAQEVVTRFFDANPDLTCDRAVRTILESLDSRAGTDNKSTRESLKEIVQTATASEHSPLEALDSAGLIAPIAGIK